MNDNNTNLKNTWRDKSLETIITVGIICLFWTIPVFEIIFAGIKSQVLVSNIIAVSVSAIISLIYSIWYFVSCYKTRKKLLKYVNTYYLKNPACNRILFVLPYGTGLSAVVRDSNKMNDEFVVLVNHDKLILYNDNSFCTYIIHYSSEIKSKHKRIIQCDENDIQPTLFSLKVIPNEQIEDFDANKLKTPKSLSPDFIKKLISVGETISDKATYSAIAEEFNSNKIIASGGKKID